MIWLTWRQFRAQAIAGAVILVAAAAAMIVDRQLVAAQWTASGAAKCPATGTCAAMDSFVQSVTTYTPMALYLIGTGLLFLVPPLVGVFWGAPLVAREFEANTYRLVWNQSVTRRRWLAVKLGTLCAAAMAFAGLLSVVVGWGATRIDQHGFDRMGQALFGARGLVPIGYAAFAFVLGVLTGIVIRRTVPAMATTLAVYLAAVGATTLWLRGHLIPPKHSSVPLDIEHIESLRISGPGGLTVTARPSISHAWVIGNDTVTSSGQPFVGHPSSAICGPDASPKSCFSWLGTQGLRQSLIYQPDSRFWALQSVEAGLFLALAALLAGLGFWWLRRRPA